MLGITHDAFTTPGRHVEVNLRTGENTTQSMKRNIVNHAPSGRRRQALSNISANTNTISQHNRTKSMTQQSTRASLRPSASVARPSAVLHQVNSLHPSETHSKPTGNNVSKRRVRFAETPVIHSTKKPLQSRSVNINPSNTGACASASKPIRSTPRRVSAALFQPQTVQNECKETAQKLSLSCTPEKNVQSDEDLTLEWGPDTTSYQSPNDRLGGMYGDYNLQQTIEEHDQLMDAHYSTSRRNDKPMKLQIQPLSGVASQRAKFYHDASKGRFYRERGQLGGDTTKTHMNVANNTSSVPDDVLSFSIFTEDKDTNETSSTPSKVHSTIPSKHRQNHEKHIQENEENMYQDTLQSHSSTVAPNVASTGAPHNDASVDEDELLARILAGDEETLETCCGLKMKTATNNNDINLGGLDPDLLL